jgi:hypothetical protein
MDHGPSEIRWARCAGGGSSSLVRRPKMLAEAEVATRCVTLGASPSSRIWPGANLGQRARAADELLTVAACAAMSCRSRAPGPFRPVSSVPSTRVNDLQGSGVIAEPDLPVLEVLEAAPDREVPVEKLEALTVLLYARNLLRSGDRLPVIEPNGALPAAPAVRAAINEAIRRRAALRSGDNYRLTNGAGLLLGRRGLRASHATREVAARALDQQPAEILREAAHVWPTRS